MGGIRVRNLFENSIMSNFFKFGFNMWMPPNDEQYIVGNTALGKSDADANFTLAAPITAMNGYFMWPCQVCVVVRNRGTAASGPPGITAANDVFAGNDALEIVVNGKLNGRVVSETLTVNIGTLTAIASQQRYYIFTNKFFDEITSIRHQNKTGTWGDTAPNYFSVGFAPCVLGNASPVRLRLMSPFKVASSSLLNNMLFPHDSTSAVTGSGATNWNITSAGVLLAPGKAPRFRSLGGLFTVDVTANTLTKTAHGLMAALVSGNNAVRIESCADGVPGNIAEGTTYYILFVDANTIKLVATESQLATEIDLTAAGTFTDGELVRVVRPDLEWLPFRLTYDDGLHVEGV